MSYEQLLILLSAMILLSIYIKTENEITEVYAVSFLAVLMLAVISIIFVKHSALLELRAVENLDVTPGGSGSIQSESKTTLETKVPETLVPQDPAPLIISETSKTNQTVLASYQVHNLQVQDYDPPAYTGDPSHPIKQGKEPPMLKAEQEPIRKEVFPVEKKKDERRECSAPEKKPVKSCVTYSSCNQRPRCRDIKHRGGLFKCRSSRMGFSGRCRLLRLRR